jgi:diguanylate cyclase (GGDEF)-like protein
MAMAAAFLYGSGAVITLASAALPQDGSATTPALVVIAAIALSSALLFWRRGTRLPRGLYPVFNSLGTLLISALVHFGGHAAGAYTLFYVWVAVYAAYFFARHEAIVVITILEGSALAVLLTPLAPPTLAPFGARVLWLTVTGTSLASAALVALLIETIRRSARTDALTGASNRAAWEEELPRAIERSARTLSPLSVAVLDLDHFKSYNDQHGHAAGDRLLAQAVAGWKPLLRKTDVLARSGGEEFAVLLPACPPHEAVEALERLRLALPGPATCSAGIATWDGRESPGELFDRADRALYTAKAAGRDGSRTAESSSAA